MKAITLLEDVHLAQAINYLEAYDLEVGLLITLGAGALSLRELLTGSSGKRIRVIQEIKRITVQTTDKE